MKWIITSLLLFFVFDIKGQGLYNYSSHLPATDALGRKLPLHNETGEVRKDKFVGLFYWTWHTQQAQNRKKPYNVTEILGKKPEAIHDFDHEIWPKERSPYYWDEPLFGYYLDTDEWVLRKHAEMLADAGVDVIIFDCTNGSFTWKESYMTLAKVFSEAREDGVKAPQIAFMLAFGAMEGSRKAMHEIYQDLYRPGLYEDLWFYWKGKPLIMAYPDNLVAIPGDKEATLLNKEIREFFTFRPAQPVYNKGPERQDHWGWLEIYPQHGFVENPDGSFEQVTVGVSQNWSKQRGLTAMNAPGVFGRSYTDAHGHAEDPQAVNYGLNFQEQWNRAFQLDPEFIFITGWNEWIAGRYEEWQQQHNAFPDQFSQEGSRDIEPMKGGHGDNYYYQLVSNIRKFKGTQPAPEASDQKTIKIDGKFDEWLDVRPEFKAHKGSTVLRDSPGWGNKHYFNSSGRNDIVFSKAASDKRFLYFYVETANDLTAFTDPNWMQLFIDIDRDKQTGWEGYDFVVNHTSPERKAYLEKSVIGWNWKKTGTAEYATKGNKLELRISKELLGISNDVDLEFKWSDNMQEKGDIMDFWMNGDVAPAGRFNYYFRVED